MESNVGVDHDRGNVAHSRILKSMSKGGGSNLVTKGLPQSRRATRVSRNPNFVTVPITELIHGVQVDGSSNVLADVADGLPSGITIDSSNPSSHAFFN
ncbi:hypothetical protein Tco_1495435, partial [Tanacetum coccineum]